MQRHHFRRLRIAVTIVFVVCAVVVMVGPTKAVSGLVTHTLDFLLAAEEAPGSIDTKAHVAFSQIPSATEQQFFAPENAAAANISGITPDGGHASHSDSVASGAPNSGSTPGALASTNASGAIGGIGGRPSPFATGGVGGSAGGWMPSASDDPAAVGEIADESLVPGDADDLGKLLVQNVEQFDVSQSLSQPVSDRAQWPSVSVPGASGGDVLDPAVDNLLVLPELPDPASPGPLANRWWP